MNRLPYLWVALVLLCLAGREAEADPPLAVAPFNSDQAKTLQQAWADYLGTPVQITNSLGVKFNLIPPGEFAMGSPVSEPGRFVDETQHLVKITQPFYLSVHEVTQQQYEQVMGKNPSKYKGENNPVENVSRNDAIAFCHKLSDEEGGEYRLPTEAEWEYACRAGITTTFSFGDDATLLGKYAWWKANSENTTHPVGRKLPNAWGLYDMHGNVYEWCQDWHAPYENLKVVSDPTGPALGSRRVLRGGGYLSPPLFVRAANRGSGLPPVYRYLYNGFRLARTIPLSP
jgi:formylglycine-generating enzyme required for sulfatase activity